MPKVESFPAGAPCWVELFTSDTQRSRSFYGDLFGWTSQDMGPDYGGYINFFKDGVHVAGCMLKDPGNPVPDVWSIYLAVDDAKATVDLERATGQILNNHDISVEEAFRGVVSRPPSPIPPAASLPVSTPPPAQ